MLCSPEADGVASPTLAALAETLEVYSNSSSNSNTNSNNGCNNDNITFE